ncbi:MAG: DUF1648 domain-containing protein [Saprospiraceae bacterium]|nr:DUF1648 domain-containing protein [Saprospiraceae bacterium]
MEQRPRIALETTGFDWILEGLAGFGLLMLLLLPLVYYSELPEIIPQHFNARGEADGFGHKSTLWLLPGIGLALYLGLSVLHRKPEWYNYPVRITAENAPRQYQAAVRLTRALKAAVMLIFAYLCWGSIQVALQQRSALPPAFLGLALALVVGVLGWYLYSAFREK